MTRWRRGCQRNRATTAEAVCANTRLADRLGMRARPVRLFFIYISLFSLGIGFAVYLTLAFWLRLKDLVYAKRTSVFDL